MKRVEYFLDFQKLEEIVGDEYLWFDERDKAAFRYEYLKQSYLNKPSRSFTYPVNLFIGNKKFNTKFELEDVLEMIKNGAAKVETEYYRQHFKEYETNLQKQQFLNSLKSFTPCGIFYNRKSRIDIRQLNGILMLQNNSVSLTDKQSDLIRNDKFTYAFFRLLQSNSFAVLVKTNSMTSKNYKHFQNYVEKYYHNLLHEKILNQTQINKVVYVTYDSELYCNNDSSILVARSNI